MKRSLTKRLAALALAALLAVSATACSGNGAASGSGSQNSSQSTSGSQTETSGPIVLTDQAGREVTLEGPAQTLVSCYYITTYATIALGVDDRVVGLENKPESRPIYQMAAPELLEQASVGSLKEFNVEAAAALDPDLVIMPLKLQDYAAALEELDIPVLIVNPESHDLLVEMLTLIGQACGVEDRAKELTDYYGEQLSRMEELTKDCEESVVYMGANSTYLETAPNDMYQSTLIDIAGGVNAAGEMEGDYWTQVSYESLLAMAPDVFIIPTAAEYTVDDVKNDPQLSQLPAVVNDAVYAMPKGIEEWDSPIPSGILGTMWLTSVLHPDVYSFETFVSDAQDFYQTFYGFDIDTSLITK